MLCTSEQMHWLIASVALTVSTGCGRWGFGLPDVDAGRDSDAMTSCTPGPDLVGYWPFDEASGDTVADYSNHGQSGDVIGDAAWASGRIGSALMFGGIDGEVALRSTSGLDFGEGSASFTITYWLNPTTLTSPTQIRPLEIAYCVGTAYIFTDVRPDGTVTFGGYDGAGNHAYTDSTAGAIEVGSWVHVAHVLDRIAKIGRTYVNGALSPGRADLSKWAGAIDCSTATYAANIGGWNAFRYAGRIDDVRIYSRALSAGEVDQISRLTTSSCL
jgi:hypothetical protein